MGGGWRIWEAIFGIRQIRQPEQAGLFAVDDYAIGKVAGDHATHSGDIETVAAVGQPAHIRHNELFVLLSSKLFPLRRFSNLAVDLRLASA